MRVVLAAFWGLASAAQAQTVPVQALHYQFESMLIPKDFGDRNVRKPDNWFTGAIVPHRLVRNASPIIVPDRNVVIEKETVFAVASSIVPIACTLGAPIPFRLVRNHACIVDLDRDGRYDHWFRRADDVVLYNWVSRIAPDDILPIEPVEVLEVDPKSLTTGTPFRVAVLNGELRACATSTGVPVCQRKGPQISREPGRHLVSYFGGQFDYELVDGFWNIRVIAPPSTQQYP